MFPECKSIRPLKFDFYFPEIQLCLEWNGRQHYESFDFFGGDKAFEGNQLRDQIKRDYCKENNIRLLEIPHWEFKNIETILEKELSFLLERKEVNIDR
jgi:hypothetical protein